ncbi:MAG: dihydroorotase [Myxococcota bacterium]
MRLVRPDDWHVHLRDGAVARAVGPASSDFARVLAMPNLAPPVTSMAEGRAYRERLVAAGVPGVRLAAYLTDRTDPDDLIAGFTAGVFLAAKLYPAGATTNAHHGVTAIDALRPVLERMAEVGMPLCVHGEVTDRAVDVFERERVFLDRVLAPLLHHLPGLRCVVEHATTREAVGFVRAHRHAAATITPHHLWWNRNALFDGGLRPHAYCLPVLKREEDRLALVAAATSGDPRFFAGTDSAPHVVRRKEMDCGCAGVFNAPTAVAAYATVFAGAGALDRLEGFLSLHGAAFYQLPPNAGTVELAQEEWVPPLTVDTDDGPVRVFLGGERLGWRLRP